MKLKFNLKISIITLIIYLPNIGHFMVAVDIDVVLRLTDPFLCLTAVLESRKIRFSKRSDPYTVLVGSESEFEKIRVRFSQIGLVFLEKPYIWIRTYLMCINMLVCLNVEVNKGIYTLNRIK